MNCDDYISETFEPLSTGIDSSGGYHDQVLMRESATARIYRAVKSGKRVIIKTPADDSGERLDLLLREYSICKNLDHRHIAHIYTWEASTPVGPGIVMEYIDGESLAEYLESEPSLKQRLRLLDQLLDGVEYIHHLGITHNDLKATNIMVSRSNRDIKIIDFGYADCDAEFLRRQLGGTPGYASPELRNRRSDADARSDIYSIGVIMRRMLGRRFSRIIDRCCDPDPSKRYANIEDLRSALKRRRRRPLLFAIGAAAASVAVAVIVGAMHISQIRSQLSGYASDTETLSDSIQRLNSRLGEYASGSATLSDSINRLNGRLGSIDRQKALEDSLTDTYRRLANEIASRYASRLRKAGYQEALSSLCAKMRVDIERISEDFTARNGDLAREIVELRGDNIMAQCSDRLIEVSKTLPSLADLYPDPVEYSRILPHAIKGEPIALPQSRE